MSDRMMKGLRALQQKAPLSRKMIVSHEPKPWRTEDGIEVLPVEDFLRRLWGDDLL